MKKLTDAEFGKCFEALFKAYSGRIYNYVLHLSGGDRYKAEEVTQIAFMKLWTKRDEITDMESMQSLMYVIARNTFLDIIEHEAVEYSYFNYILKNQKSHDNVTEETVDYNFLMGYILKIVEELPPVRRTVFRKHRDEHLTYRQIADELGISVNTVEIHMMLALRYIREQLRNRYNILTTLCLLFANIVSPLF